MALNVNSIKLRVKNNYSTFENEGEEEIQGSGHHRESERQSCHSATYSVEDAIESIGFGWFNIRVALICGLLFATDALEVQLLTVLSPELECQWKIDKYHLPLLTSCVFFGMFVFSPIWGSWADKYGRKKICFMAAVWILYFGMLTASSPNFVWIVTLRCLCGVGFGGALQSITMYAEYLPSKYRAKALVINMLMWAAGGMAEVLLASYIVPTWGWRRLVAVSTFPALFTVLSIYFLPESARYLVVAGRKEEATQLLETAAYINGAQMIKGQLVEVQTSYRGQLQDLLRPEYARITAMLMVLSLVISFSYYGGVIISSQIRSIPFCNKDTIVETGETCFCHILQNKDYSSMIIASLGEFFVVPINLVTIDLFGRRIALSLCFAGAGVCFLLLQFYCTTFMAMTVLLVGVRGFTIGLFSVITIYVTEVYPTTVRSLGLGVCQCASKVGAMLTPFFAQTLLKESVPVTLWIYGLTNLLCCGAALLLPVETKGRAMQQTCQK